MIYYVMGKSASGKDTIYRELKKRLPDFKSIIMYTTRPIREGEQDGVEYFFRDEAFLEACRREGRLIECRTYETVHGPWSYFTVDDGQAEPGRGNYLMIGTLESFEKLREYYGAEVMYPVYIQVEDGVRLRRALDREDIQKEPKYAELCRRFLADEKDFSEENLKRCGVEKRYENRELEECVTEILGDVKEG